MQTAIKKGVHEDSGVLRVLVKALLKISDQFVNVGKLALRTLDDVAKASEFIAGQVTCGKMTPEQGLAVGQVLEGHRKILETRDIKEHLEALEESELRKS